MCCHRQKEWDREFVCVYLWVGRQLLAYNLIHAICNCDNRFPDRRCGIDVLLITFVFFLIFCFDAGHTGNDIGRCDHLIDIQRSALCVHDHSNRGHQFSHDISSVWARRWEGEDVVWYLTSGSIDFYSRCRSELIISITPVAFISIPLRSARRKRVEFRTMFWLWNEML